MTVEDHENRAREIADTTRRYLIALNTGGVAMLFAVASSLAAEDVNPGWATWPAGIFILGLTISAASLFLAKHKALKRRDAAAKNGTLPDYSAWYWANFSYEILALVFFLVAAIVGLLALNCVVV